MRLEKDALDLGIGIGKRETVLFDRILPRTLMDKPKHIITFSNCEYIVFAIELEPIRTNYSVN